MTPTVHTDPNADAARRWIAERLRWERFLDHARRGGTATSTPAPAPAADDAVERPAA